MRPDTISDAVDGVSALPAGARLMIAFPLSRSGRVSHRLVAGNLRSLGFARVLADGAPAELSELLAPEAEPGVTVPDLAASREVLVVVDRIKAVRKPDRRWRDRLADSLATCFREGEGEAVVVPAARREPGHCGSRRRSAAHGTPGLPSSSPSPKLFSFNNPYGSCPVCTGFGATLEYDPG